MSVFVAIYDLVNNCALYRPTANNYLLSGRHRALERVTMPKDRNIS